MLNSILYCARRSAYVFVFALTLISVTTTSYAQSASADDDNDGVTNFNDNCDSVANPNQIDADADGFGNMCDGDLNNDLVVNFLDYALFTAAFLSTDPVADLNEDGVVNFLDIPFLTNQFFSAPGPSGVAAAAYTYQGVQMYSANAVGSILHMTEAPGDATRWYALQRQGKMVSFSKDESSTVVTDVLDIQSLVDTVFEGGALGFTFDPNFQTNGYVYVSYTASGPNFQIPLISRVSRFSTTVDVNGVAIADPLSELILIAVDQPFSNHNGGFVDFGPDGYLYWGLGDGGASGDPQRNGQDTRTLLSTMLRLDVNLTQEELDLGLRYKIPSTNPFSMNADCTVACPEIFAWGLRNPWRWSFDSETGDLWVGDVGQNAIEEIAVVAAGENHGWRCFEGGQTFNTAGCDLTQTFTDPVHTYTHSFGFSITGGNVYRGAEYPELNGMYFFADFGSGTMWGIYKGDFAGVLLNTGDSVVSFASDSAGELYYLDLGFGGANTGIYRITASN